jgi:hypothetical protein
MPLAVVLSRGLADLDAPLVTVAAPTTHNSMIGSRMLLSKISINS